MSSKPPVSSTIEAYRKKRQRPNPLILYIIAGVLGIIGIVIIILAVTGGREGGGFNLFATKTPTPTITPSPTNTIAPTLTSTVTETPTVTPTSTASVPFSYVVQEGDTLYDICERLELGENCLLNIYLLNPQIDPVLPIIRVGDTIILPYPGMPLSTPTPWPTGARQIIYFVLPGDSLGAIANKFNSTVDAIVKANKDLLEDANSLIYPGIKLVIPINIVTPVSTFTPTPTPTQ